MLSGEVTRLEGLLAERERLITQWRDEAAAAQAAADAAAGRARDGDEAAAEVCCARCAPLQGWLRTRACIGQRRA